MPTTARRIVAILLAVVAASALVACSDDGGGTATPTSVPATTAGDGSPTTSATSGTSTTTTAGTTTTTTPPLLDRLAGVWIGGDPVQWARATCLAAGDASACTDLATQVSWQRELVTCLRAKGLAIELDERRLVASTGRGDPGATSTAWEACRAVYVRAFDMAAATVDANLWSADCLASRGWISVLHDPIDASMRDDSAACQPGIVLRACYRDNGANLGDPAVFGVRSRYEPAAAQAVWAACRDLARRVSYVAWQGDVAWQYADCMAARGWLVEDYTSATGVPYDAYVADLSACHVPSTQERFITCLRDNGVTEAVVPTAATVLPALGVRAVGEAQAVWRACRDSWLAWQISPGTVEVTLFARFPDCMADQGWLVLVPYGSITDQAAYEQAANVCNEPRNGGPVARSGGLPAFPTAAAWATCFRDAGVAAATDRRLASSAPQVFPAAATTDAYVRCATRYTGVPASIFQTCAANRGVVPGLGGTGTWDTIEACGLARWSFGGREITEPRRRVLRCLVEHGSTTDPLLHAFDVVLGAWEECAAAQPGAGSDVTLAMYDRTAADLPTLRYWACLADHGLRVPDPRRTGPAPTLGEARAAIAACAASAVTVREPLPYYGD